MATVAETDYLTKPYTIEDFKRVQALFASCFSPRDDSYFRWKYHDNPAGAMLGFCCFDKQTQQLAAFYGVIPERYWQSGKPVAVFQSMDTMTHPQHRGKKLFVHLARHTMKAVTAQHPAAFLIGFPGVSSFHGFTQSLGWHHAGSIVQWATHSLPLRVLSTNRNRVSIESYDKARPFDAQWNAEVWQPSRDDAVSSGYTRYTKDLSAETLNWRLFENPMTAYVCAKVFESASGVLVGGVVATIRQKTATIHMICFRSQRDEGLYLGAALNALIQANDCRFVRIFAPVAGERSGRLRRLGSVGNPLRRGPLSYRVPLITWVDPSTQQDLARPPIDRLTSFEMEQICMDY